MHFAIEAFRIRRFGEKHPFRWKVGLTYAASKGQAMAWARSERRLGVQTYDYLVVRRIEGRHEAVQVRYWRPVWRRLPGRSGVGPKLKRTIREWGPSPGGVGLL